MIEVTLAAGAAGCGGVAGVRCGCLFRDTPVEAMRTQLNRLVLYVFYPCILFGGRRQHADRVLSLCRCHGLLGIGTLSSGALLSVPLYPGHRSAAG